MGNVLPFMEARDTEDEKHVHPLQKDVIERACVLRSNPGETVLTPFMGVGSEVCGALSLGRRGMGMELKPSYYRQAIKNIEDEVKNHVWTDPTEQTDMFDEAMDEPESTEQVGA